MGKKSCIVVMNVLYYVAFVALIAILILPHTTIFYSWRLFDPFSKRVNTKTVYLTVGEEYRIRLLQINKRLHYYSSDFKVADVDDNGIVGAYRPGKVIITIKAKKATYKYRFYVMKLNRKKLVIRKSSIHKLSLKGVHFGVRWKSSNANVASVNRFGLVHGKRKGTAYITVSAGGRKLKCKVYVR